MKTSLSHRGNHSRGTGLGLVELMVALALSLFLMAGVLQIFLGSKQTYNAVEQVSRMQENARYVVEAVSHATRNTGYTGCSTSQGPLTNTLNSATSVAFDFGTGVSGFEANGSGPGSTITITSENPTASGTWNGAVPTDVAAIAISGSDMLIVRVPGGGNVPIAELNASTDVFARLTGAITDGCPGPADRLSGICLGDILLVSDCTKSRVFQVTALAEKTDAPCSTSQPCVQLSHDDSLSTPGNSITAWGGPYAPEEERFGPDAEILRLQTTMFFVGVGGDGTPSFYQRVNANSSQELVSGVENMQILYGEDSDADGVANRYRAADAVTDFQQVVSLRLSLLVRTDQPISSETNTQTYRLNGVTAASATTIDPFNDRRGRFVFTSTIKLRNRNRGS